MVKVTELEDRSIKIIQPEEHGEKLLKRKVSKTVGICFKNICGTIPKVLF